MEKTAQISLKLVSFNFRCFGYNGDYFAPKPFESRLEFLKSFIQKNYIDTDVFVLQEIMDLKLVHRILPEDFKIYSYEHPYKRHMYVVLACKKDFDFIESQTIANTALDQTKSRPALYGKLAHSTKPLAHIIGVHLKSSYEHTENRKKQAQSICDFIQGLNEDLPTIIAGDFNSHVKEKTQKEKDDLDYLAPIFQKQGLDLIEHKQSTYITSHEAASLDHIWSTLPAQSIEVYDFAQGYSQLNEYFRKISDHMPVMAQFKI